MAGGAELGVYGLAAMGANLARNAARNGFHVAVFNRTKEKTTDFIDRHSGEGSFTAAETIEDFVGALASPRVVLLMIEAGSAIDDIVGQLRPFLAPGDIVIDAGNSLHSETDRRVGEAAVHGHAFVGMGVSGGEKGTLEGPSLMVGGDPAAYQHLEPILTKMAAKVGDRPCRAHFGPGAAGHYVKMVHNGIEYTEMQALAEVYDVLRSTYRLDADEIADIFAGWQDGELSGFLLDTAVTVLRRRDDDTGRSLVDVVLDEADRRAPADGRLATPFA